MQGRFGTKRSHRRLIQWATLEDGGSLVPPVQRRVCGLYLQVEPAQRFKQDIPQRLLSASPHLYCLSFRLPDPVRIIHSLFSATAEQDRGHPHVLVLSLYLFFSCSTIRSYANSELRWLSSFVALSPHRNPRILMWCALFRITSPIISGLVEGTML